MIAFFLKKAFFDGWDHAFALIALNLAAIAAVALVLLGPVASGSFPVAIAGLASLALLLGVHAVASSSALKAAADFRSVRFSDYLDGLRRGFGRGLFFGLLLVLVAACVWIAVPFYLRMRGPIGTVALGVVFWCALGVALSIQWFPAVCAYLPGPLPGQLRKCFILMFDNSGFSLFLAFTNLAVLLLSLFTAFLAPGPAGIWLGTDVALRLRLRKYDWLEANPGADRRRIPWPELLAEDEELVGKRTLRNFIFPWKD
ncbi:MAG: hypothetical protein NT080_06480 [Spirochaetes bacterium]|nr:hypothetical protein [Spirochaetota bacterium]